jgi:predicted RNA-binding Zn-ribbon protein involved in translation (DUF1610 family)
MKCPTCEASLALVVSTGFATWVRHCPACGTVVLTRTGGSRSETVVPEWAKARLAPVPPVPPLDADAQEQE